MKSRENDREVSILISEVGEESGGRYWGHQGVKSVEA